MFQAENHNSVIHKHLKHFLNLYMLFCFQKDNSTREDSYY